MKVIVFTETDGLILSNKKYATVGNASQHAFEDQDYEQTLADARVSGTSVCQLPDGESLKIDLQTSKAKRCELC